MDVDGIWAFLLDRIRSMAARHAVDALIVTTHGATGALIDADGALALPVLDYEHDGPDRLAAAYDAVRPDFAETGSPRLAVGLNLGAQLFFLSRTFPRPSPAARTSSPIRNTGRSGSQASPRPSRPRSAATPTSGTRSAGTSRRSSTARAGAG